MSLTYIDRQSDSKTTAFRPGGEYEREDYFLSGASDPHRNLLVAVLHRAVMDLRQPIQISTSEDRRSAVRWFKSKSKRSWGFLWVCGELDLDPVIIKKASFSWVRSGAETRIEVLTEKLVA